MAKHIDGSKASIDKLAKIITYKDFKGLIRENREALDSKSVDIDDNAFVWWLAATAAISPDEFYNSYRSVIGEEVEGQRPIAPLPTQELGVYALVAFVVNGDMFNHFGSAIRQSLIKTWEDATPEQRLEMQKDFCGKEMITEDNIDLFKNLDFFPNFDNIMFIEGVAGSGKSKGVLNTWSRVLTKANPEFVDREIIFAHTDKTKAENLGKSTAFKNVKAHDKASLMRYISAEWTPPTVNAQGVSEYILNKDVVISDGYFRSKYNIQQYDPNDVPKIMVIDEWTHYDQIEQELIQRFARNYGVALITAGDYDQLTAEAVIKRSANEKAWFYLTPHRNMTARSVKLGISMRTDNEVKNNNMSRLTAWVESPKKDVELHYYEDDTSIYGDKVYRVGLSYGSELDAIKQDVLKMINDLEEGEQIGYIYHTVKDSSGKQVVNSALYDWLTTTEGVKDKIKLYLETDAHGLEAKYYIVENNRSNTNNALTYFRSLNTGITRSERGSIVIAPDTLVSNGGGDAHNKVGINIVSVQDKQMLPNTYTDEGTRAFSRNVKGIYDSIYGDRAVTPFTIKPRTRVATTINAPVLDSDPSLDLDDPEQPEVEQSGQDGLGEVSAEPEKEVQQQLGDIAKDIDPDQEEWHGPFPNNTILYDKYGIARWAIVGESENDSEGPKYQLRDINTNEVISRLKDEVHNEFFLNKPTLNKLFIQGDKVVHQGAVKSVNDVFLERNDSGDVFWVYNIDGENIPHNILQDLVTNNQIHIYTDPVYEAPSHRTTIHELGDQSDYQSDMEDIYSEEVDEQVDVVSELGDDIDLKVLGFTFNTLYVADAFDEDGNIIVTEQDAKRIDQGYGLIKMNGETYNTRAKAKAALEVIRQYLMFKSNADIARAAEYVIGNPKYRRLHVKWGFVSKGANSNKGKHARYNRSTGVLEDMQRDDINVLHKYLSAIICDDTGTPILELPVMSIQSPHSILRAMRDKGIASDLTELWTFGEKSEGQTEKELNAIRDRIAEKYSGYKGYENLSDLITLWLFTSNGFKLLPEGWNLSSNCPNLGNFFITQRTSDNYEKHNFRGEWVDMTTNKERARFTSSIMMNKSNTYADPVTGNPIPIFRPYTPYVLISDSPDITTNEEAARRYLAQQADSRLEKIVKAVPAVPPQVSVRAYIENIHKAITKSDNYEPFGNKFTAYRIWEAIINSPYAQQIMVELSQEKRDFVISTIQELATIRQNNPQKPGETNLAYKERLANLTKVVLNRNTGNEGNVSKVFSRLRSLLKETCIFNPLRDPKDYTTNDEIINLIEAACSEYGITGVMCHPKLVKSDASNVVGGFAVLVETDRDGYSFPGHGSFRNFGKIDLPTFDISSLLNDGIIKSWIKDSVKGKTYTDRQTGNVITLPNVWEFMDKSDEDFYLLEETERKINLEDPIKFGQELLAKLGITDYNIDVSELVDCVSEDEAREIIQNRIHEKYLEIPGAFLVTINGVTKYGNIISERTQKYETYIFDSIKLEGSKYLATFIDMVTSEPVEIPIELDSNSNAFKIMPTDIENTANNETSINIAQLKQDIIDDFNRSRFKDNPAFVELMSIILSRYDEVNNVVDVEAIREDLKKAKLSTLQEKILISSLKLDLLENQNSLDSCVTPIKIYFK